jgi:dihydrofolate reductase
VTPLTADLFVSLDGFALGIDVGPYFGYAGPELDSWVREHLEQPQVIVMGRVTYEEMAKLRRGRPTTRLLRGDLAEQVRALKRQSADPLRSIGSLTLVRSLLHLGLVDRLRLTIFPLLLGDAGREPFYPGHPRSSLELIGTRVLDSRVVMLEYRPAPGGAS